MRAALPWTAPIAALASRAAAPPWSARSAAPRALAGGQRLGRVLARRGRELLHRGRGFLQAGCLFLGATRQIMVAGGDLARRAFDRGGPGLHLTHRAAQSFAHPVQRRQQPGRLVAPLRGARAQVRLGHAPRQRRRLDQRPGDRARDQHAQRERGQRQDNQHAPQRDLLASDPVHLALQQPGRQRRGAVDLAVQRLQLRGGLAEIAAPLLVRQARGAPAKRASVRPCRPAPAAPARRRHRSAPPAPARRFPRSRLRAMFAPMSRARASPVSTARRCAAPGSPAASAAARARTWPSVSAATGGS